MYSAHLCSWSHIHVHILLPCCQQSSNKSLTDGVCRKRESVFDVWCLCVSALHMWHTFVDLQRTPCSQFSSALYCCSPEGGDIETRYVLYSIVVWQMHACSYVSSLSRSLFQDILQERLIKCPLLRPMEPLRPIPHLLTPTRRPCIPLEVPIPSRTSMLR